MNEEKNQEVDVEALLREADRWHQRDLVGGDLAARLARALRAERGKSVGAVDKAVEELLREADVRSPSGMQLADSVGANAAPELLSDRGVIFRLARALRGEQTRVDFHQQAEAEIGDHNRVARAHLRAIIAHAWPEGTTAPACVREARDFLAGKSADGAARRADELLTAAGVHEDELSRRIEALVLDRDKAQTEVQRIRADLATLNKLHEEALREQDKLEAALSSERDQHAKSRAKLQAEEEAHANTRAEFATERARCLSLIRHPLGHIIPKDDTERGILDFVTATIKTSGRKGAEVIFDLLVQATRAAEERKDKLDALMTVGREFVAEQDAAAAKNDYLYSEWVRVLRHMKATQRALGTLAEMARKGGA